METRTRKLGPGQPLTQFSITGMASTYRHQERIKDAELLEFKLQDIDESKHPRGCPGEFDEEIGNHLWQEIQLDIARNENNNGDGSHREQDSLVAHGHATYCRHFNGDISFQYMRAWTGK
ncbi:hypothetical protein N7481_006964 [Penicillium waksmanii]|uniref:uncharacterized protein n=1 Tax=Penicillium waksmanii TaxID=69791 RepID=UPI002549081B|nr:uncharacterized protein N7481_006964 [Penicillium waksmanii]KAJ5979666.1 hypothetical protein N7481_006964 [Penicillium waksmanii]